MKIITLILVALLSLTACRHDIKPIPPEKLVIKETRYVIKVPPPELLTLPAKPGPISADDADQADVADWLIRKEEYTMQLENLIKQIGKFFKQEQDKLDETAK
jgi:hypothetical protein